MARNTIVRHLSFHAENTETTAKNATANPDPVRLEIRAPDTLGKGDAQRMYDLMKSNMHDMYVVAGWGWHADEKWREMAHRDARFLTAWCGDDDVVKVESGKAEMGYEPLEKGRENTKSMTSEVPAKPDDEGVVVVPGEESGERNVSGSARRRRESKGVNTAKSEKGENDGRKRLAGFCHFRFAWDADENEDGEGVGGKEDALYVYELQVAPWAERRGLGRRMMQALEVRGETELVACARGLLTIFCFVCALCVLLTFSCFASFVSFCPRRQNPGGGLLAHCHLYPSRWALRCLVSASMFHETVYVAPRWCRGNR